MIITFGNFKGGVGKTTTTTLFSYILSELQDKKVLAIDTDPQTNLTERLSSTFLNDNVTLDPEKNIFNAMFSDDPVRQHIQSLTNNLDILAGTWDMINFEKMVSKAFQDNYSQYVLQATLEEVADNYDYILIDTAPSTNGVMVNALMASDFILITTQTLQDAYESTQKFYNFLLQYYQVGDYHFELLGVLPYLVGKSATDHTMLNNYLEIFKEELFKNHIKTSDRVKSWSSDGVTKDKPYDKKTLQMYEAVVLEAQKRMGE